MRIRYVVSVIAVASTLLAGSLTAAGAATAPAVAAGPGVSCSSPPDPADATSEDRDRFVSTWLARFKDQAWMDDYLAQDTVPADVLAEGFHAMGDATKAWLNACLVDAMLSYAGETADQQRREYLLTGANLVIFGKQQMAELREELEEPEPTPAELEQPAPEDQTGDALTRMNHRLTHRDALTAGDLPRTDETAPDARVTSNNARVAQVVSADAGPTPTALPLPGTLLSIPPVPQLLAAVDALLQLIAQIQGVLFTLPGLNILASAFYKICAESPTMPLKCSISLPVGVPIPADVTGDNVPDLTGWLSPLVGGGAVGAKFQVKRLFPKQGKLPAHVFAVYDPPAVKKRIQFGYDGRADSLANRTTTTFKLHNVLNALTGDVNVSADLETFEPGASQALTFAIKDLVGGSIGVPAAEENPMAGAVRMAPVPASFDLNARLVHTSSKDQDTFKVGSSVPTKVDAVVTQDTTTTTPKSHREFTATIDKLPTSVTVDLTHEGEVQTIDYQGSAPISHVQASDTAVPDTDHPDTYTRSVYDVEGVPTHVNVRLQGGEDITYSANAKIPQVGFDTQTFADGVLQQQISAQAHQVPKQVHVLTATEPDLTTFTYDADSSLQDVVLSMYDLAADETNLQATATGIPTHMEFTQNKATGVYDFSADQGVGTIEGSLSRGGGLILPMVGDHATVLKSGDGLGLDFRLSGFRSAHFDGTDDLNVVLGLDPGGQSFDAYADLDDPNVVAEAHVSDLPSTIGVTVSPDGENATYDASSSIGQISASILQRDTDDALSVDIGDVPTHFTLQLDADGSTIVWDADAVTGHIGAAARLTPASIGGTRTFEASLGIDDIPDHWEGSWAGGTVLFEAPAPGIGSIQARVTNHGDYHVLGGDHVSAYYREASGDLDASLRVSNLRRASFTKLDGGDGGGFEARLQMGNHSSFAFAADVVVEAGILDASGQFSNLPADITLRSEGGRITYDGDTNPDLTVRVAAGTSAAALAAAPAPLNVHGVSVRDGADGEDRAVRANLFLTGLPDHLDINSPAGIYEVDGYHPSQEVLVVDAVLTTLAPEPVKLRVEQGVPTTAPVDFTFGPFTTDTVAGVPTLDLNYTASAPLKALFANVQYGATDEAQLEISSIPESINVHGEFGADQKKVGVHMSDGIDDITASYRKVGAGPFAASVHLSDVPSAVDLLIGRATDSAGDSTVTAPDFTMTASDPGLDIEATVTAEIADPVDAKAAASLKVTDLGEEVTGRLEGTSVTITSTPATGSFLLSASGEINVDADLGFQEAIFKNEGTLDVHVDIFSVTLGFQDASNLTIDLGITTGLRGDFSGFQFGLDTDTEIEIHDTLSIFIDWPDPLGSTTWDVASVHANIDFDNLIEAWHVNSNTWGDFASLEDPLIGCGAHLELIPGPGTSTSNSSTLNLPAVPGAPSGFTDAWLITPDIRVFNLSLPDWILDLVAYFATPYESDWDVRIGC